MFDVYIVQQIMKIFFSGSQFVEYSWQPRHKVPHQVEFNFSSSPPEFIPQQVCEVLARKD